MEIKCEKTEYVFESKWVRVRKDHIIINNEKQSDYYIVEKMDVVLILAFNQKNEIILVSEYKYPVNQIMTGIPGGTIIRGTEEPLEAAKRELKEETGCESDEWAFFIKAYEYPTKDIHEVSFFIAKNCIQTSAQKMDENEELTFEWVPFQTAINKVILNEVNHGCTAYALLKCAAIYPDFLKSV